MKIYPPVKGWKKRGGGFHSGVLPYWGKFIFRRGWGGLAKAMAFWPWEPVEMTGAIWVEETMPAEMTGAIWGGVKNGAP